MADEKTPKNDPLSPGYQPPPGEEIVILNQQAAEELPAFVGLENAIVMEQQGGCAGGEPS
jgi:hypothetical protein